MDLKQTLENIGLTDKEAKIYLTLLTLREALPGSIAKKANVKRPTTYVVLDQLERKGFVSKVKKTKYIYYQPVTPYILLEEQNKRLIEMRTALPELLNLHQQFAIRPQMSFFEGKNGIINIMEDTLTTKTELLCWANASLATETLLNDYYPSYIKKKVERKIWLKGIFSYDKKSLDLKKRSAEELREIYLISKKDFPFKNEINIYDDKVAIISHEDQIGVIIQNQNIADTQRSIFAFAFKYAKLAEKDVITKADMMFLENKIE